MANNMAAKITRKICAAGHRANKTRASNTKIPVIAIEDFFND
jgi:hypothetical protein